MFCPSCGARNATGARTCVECNRALPAPRPGAAGSTTPLDVAPTIHDVPKTAADAPGSSPAQAPVQPPRILKKPAPLAPAPIDVVPRNPAPPPSPPLSPAPSPAPSPALRTVSAEDPTVVRRQPQAPVPVTPSSAQRHVAHSSPPPIQTGELAATRPARPATVTMPSNPPSAPASADVPFPSASPVSRPQPPSFAAPSTRTGGETEPLPRAPRAVTNGGPNGASSSSSSSSSMSSSTPSPLAATVEIPMPVMPPKAAAIEAGPSRRAEAKGADARPAEAKATAPRPATEAKAAVVDASTDVTAQAPAYAPPEHVVLDVTHGLRWLSSSLIDTAFGAAFATAAAGFLLDRKGVRLDVQPIVDFIHKSPAAAVILIGGGAFAGLALYQVLTVALLGGTLGQRVLGLRVLRLKDGARAGIVRSVVRGVLCAGGSLFLLAGPLFGVFLDRRRRGLGDLFARTVVARRGEST